MILLLGCIIVALIVHEIGHALMALALGLDCHLVAKRWRLGILFGDSTLRRWQVVVVAAAGPLANVVFAAIAYELGMSMLVLGNLVAVLNLVPFPHSDGAKMLRPGRAIH